MAKKAEHKHILVLRFSALGDVAMMVPVLLALTKKYPELKVTLVSRAFHRPLFETIDNVTFYPADLKDNHKGFWGLFRLYKSLRKLRIDAIADLHNVLRTNVLKEFFRIDGKTVVQINKGRQEKKALVRPNSKDLKPLTTTHERYADVFTKLGFPVQMDKTNHLERLNLSEKALQLAGKDTLKWIGIAPFAAHSGKMYPVEKIKVVIRKLLKTKRYKIFLFGGGKVEKEQLDAMVFDVQNVINVAGTLSFSEELELISNLDLMVSMDSANGHLAANYGVPVITLWGVTHPYLGFYPYGQPLKHALLSDRNKFPMIPTSVYGNKVPKGYENVMDTISREDVVQKIEEVLHDQ